MALIQISQTQARIPVTIFQLQENIKLGNYKELEQAVEKAIESGMHDLIIDLSKSETLTSIGLRALVVIHKMLSADGGTHLKLAGPLPPIHDTLQITGITQFIDIYDSVEEAAASF